MKLNKGSAHLSTKPRLEMLQCGCVQTFVKLLHLLPTWLLLSSSQGTSCTSDPSVFPPSPSPSSLTHPARYDHDSGHDSGSEDTCYELSQPFTLLTVGMGKLFIPKASSSSSSSSSAASASAAAAGDRVLPMPQRLGVCLDYDACRVYFYDADTMRCLYERQVDCSGTMYPAFGLMGSGRVQLEEFIMAKKLTF